MSGQRDIFSPYKVDERPLTGHTESGIPVDYNGNLKYDPLSGLEF
jgi:hypothetical protein